MWWTVRALAKSSLRRWVTVRAVGLPLIGVKSGWGNGKTAETIVVAMVEEGPRDRESERASSAAVWLIVENSAGLHRWQEPQRHRCGQGRENRYCSSVEGNLVVNKGELQYYDYSIAVSSTSLLALTHVPNLVAAPVWFVRRMDGASYSDINIFLYLNTCKIFSILLFPAIDVTMSSYSQRTARSAEHHITGM